MTYKDLTINQRISLKAFISDKKERNYGLNHKESHKWLDGIHALALVSGWIAAINYFLQSDND